MPSLIKVRTVPWQMAAMMSTFTQYLLLSYRLSKHFNSAIETTTLLSFQYCWSIVKLTALLFIDLHLIATHSNALDLIYLQCIANAEFDSDFTKKKQETISIILSIELTHPNEASIGGAGPISWTANVIGWKVAFLWIHYESWMRSYLCHRLVCDIRLCVNCES